MRATQKYIKGTQPGPVGPDNKTDRDRGFKYHAGCIAQSLTLKQAKAARG